MKKFCIIIGIALSLMLAGCLSSLHPLFTEKDIVFDPRLIGSWKAPGDDETIAFEKVTAADHELLPSGVQPLASKGYIVSLKNKEGIAEVRYIGFLCRLDDEQYLDFFPIPTGRQQQYNEFYRQHMVNMHSFYRIRHKKDSLEIGQLKEDFLKDLINKKQIRIQHEVRSDGSFVITAPTTALQQYVLKYGQVPEAYESTATYFKN